MKSLCAIDAKFPTKSLCAIGVKFPKKSLCAIGAISNEIQCKCRVTKNFCLCEVLSYSKYIGQAIRLLITYASSNSLKM